jgi:hypothetical protein
MFPTPNPSLAPTPLPNLDLVLRHSCNFGLHAFRTESAGQVSPGRVRFANDPLGFEHLNCTLKACGLRLHLLDPAYCIVRLYRTLSACWIGMTNPRAAPAMRACPGLACLAPLVRMMEPDAIRVGSWLGWPAYCRVTGENSSTSREENITGTLCRVLHNRQTRLFN